MSSPLTDEALRELEETAKAATPGIASEDPDGEIEMRGVGACLPMEGNAQFIAAANPETVLALVEEVRELRAFRDHERFKADLRQALGAEP